MCWEWINRLTMYIVGLLVKSCLKNLVWSVSFNLFIVLGYPRLKSMPWEGLFHVSGNRVAYFHLSQSTGTGGIPLVFWRIGSPTGFPPEEINSNCRWWGSLLVVDMLSEHLNTCVNRILYWWVPVFPSIFFTSNVSPIHSSIKIICSPWCIHFEISVLRSIHNLILVSFWIFISVRASNCWVYALPALALTVGHYTVIIMVLTLSFPLSSIHEQRPRFLKSWPIAIDLRDTSCTSMMAVPPLLNGPSEVVIRLYPVLILLVLNHPLFLLYIFYFMGILLQLMFTSASPTTAIPSLIMIFFKIYNLCCIGWSDAWHILPMFWYMILIIHLLFPPLSWLPQLPRRFLLGLVSVVFGIPLWRFLGGFG